MKVWPDDDPKARPASEFFVNERIDLLVREAETFRNDYRNKERRIVFHALKKPLPWAADHRAARRHVSSNPPMKSKPSKYCGFVLISIVFGCGVVSTLIISRQNRLTR